MGRRLWIWVMAVLLVASFHMAAQQGEQGSWKGTITDTHCGTKAHMGDPADCMKKCAGMGSKYALLSADKVYVLEPQDKVAEHAGHKVKVQGTLEGNTIKVASVEMAKAKEVEKSKQ
jgi:hypothetical protein